MNANELADELTKMFRGEEYDRLVHEIPDMLRQQKTEYYSLLVNHDKLYAKVVEQQAEIERLKALNTIKDAGILTMIKLIADDISGYKDYENTYADGWLDACNTVYDDVFAILRKAQEK
jgi:hypothetical protein